MDFGSHLILIGFLFLLFVAPYLFVRNPSIGLICVFFAVPFGGIEPLIFGQTPKIFFAQIIGFLLVILILMKKMLQGNIVLSVSGSGGFFYQKRTFLYLVVIYICLASLSVFRAVEFNRTVYIVFDRVLVLVLFITALHYNQHPIDRFRILYASSIVGAIIAVMYLWNAVLVYDATSFATLASGLAKKDNLANAGMIGVSNTIASIMIFTIALTWSLMSMPGIPGKQRSIAIISAMFQIACLVATCSRSGIVALVGGMILANLTFLKIRLSTWFRLIKLSFICFAVGSLVFLVLPQQVYMRYAVHFSITTLSRQIINRLELYLISFKAFIESPLLGIGIGNIRFYGERYGPGFGCETHNLYIQTLAEEGVLSFIVLSCILLIMGFRLLLMNRRSLNWSQAGVFAAFLATLLDSSVSPTFWAPQFAYFFWISMAILACGPVPHFEELGRHKKYGFLRVAAQQA